MASTERTITAGLYAHSGICMGYLVTSQPLTIPEIATAMRLAKQVPAEPYGEVRLKLREHADYPDLQGFMLFPQGRHITRKQFELLLQRLFPGCKWDTEWITSVRDERLIIALLMRSVFDRR